MRVRNVLCDNLDLQEGPFNDGGGCAPDEDDVPEGPRGSRASVPSSDQVHADTLLRENDGEEGPLLVLSCQGQTEGP